MHQLSLRTRFAGILITPLLLAAVADAAGPRVRPGIDVLATRGFAPLHGQRVGLITNPTGVTADLRSTIDVLNDSPSVQLVALFGPEHGVRGEITAGEKISDARDALTNLPIRSLYGQHRKPTAEMLADLDVLVFDIQDIGSRSYTFISTMAAAMEAAAENNVGFVVLDRPNPLGGDRIEGRVLDLEYKSFVGYLPVPYVHGLTVGELARMINGEGWLADGRQCDLHVVEMEGWRRDMLFEDTGLPWVLTSPHIPHADTALFYAATGIMGELHVISEGVGYTLPFELAGMPDLNPQKLADNLNRRNLPGVHFRPLFFKPYYLRHEGATLGGVQIHLLEPRRVELTPIQFHIMDAVRQIKPEVEYFGGRRNAMFDKVCGTDQIRRMFSDRRPLGQILSFWSADLDRFRQQRAPYLLYR